MPARARTNKPNAKTTFLPKTFSFSVLFRKRTKNHRNQAIQSDLAARTLYVVDGEDIIITSLDRKPFCCQDELTCMRRSELCRVARELNRKLPQSLTIGPLTYMSEDVIRYKIEEMMGFRHFRRPLRKDTAPGRNQSPNSVVELEFLLSRSRRSSRSSASSLSSRSSKSSSPYGLDVVEESDEESGLYFC